MDKRILGARQNYQNTMGGKRGEPSQELTKREVDVVAMAALGLNDKNIGVALGINYGTVKHHMYNVHKKLGYKNRTELVLWYYGMPIGIAQNG